MTGSRREAHAKNLAFLLLFAACCAADAVEPAHPLEPRGLHEAAAISENALTAYENGYRHYRAGRFSDAMRCFQEALKREPNLLKAHYWLGKVYREMGRLREADFHWEEVLRLQKLVRERREALSVQTNEYPALSQLKQTRKREEEAEESFQEGKHLLKEGHWEGAVACIKKAVGLYPANPDYQKLLARLLWDRNDRQASAKTYVDMLDLHRDTDRDLVEEATDRLVKAGWHKEAARILREATRRFSGDAVFQQRLSSIEDRGDAKPVSSGTVIDRSRGLAILDIGLESGLTLADEYTLKLRSFRPGESITDPKTGRVIGRHPDTVTADLLVTKVFARSCWALIRQDHGRGVKAGDLIEVQSGER
ncbi:MAG TPA: tetratricopeptide repeat protein [Candidatus Ozemobacteraceae bacterium]|nr:tetratricopeptide repeat protein [Candidatus Ozemobacteraceae bacterium]